MGGVKRDRARALQEATTAWSATRSHPVPANLVTKWEDELAAGSNFRKCLNLWADSRKTSAQRVKDTLTHVLPIRSGKHVRQKRNRGRLSPPPGTYIISQSLFLRKGHGLSALRREKWDIIIVDEAHNKVARDALKKLANPSYKQTKFLLTATPFQLEPRQINDVARNLTRHYKILSRPEIAKYLEGVDQAFKRETAPGPQQRVVREASQTLRKLIARTLPKKSNRRYFILNLNGTQQDIATRLHELRTDDDVNNLLDAFRGNNHSTDRNFEAEYFKARVRLATPLKRNVNGEPPKRFYVATALRKILARGTDTTDSPRLVALSKWARQNLEKDLHWAIDNGVPRKTVVFTSFVGGGRQGEAALLKTRLLKSFASALYSTRRSYGSRWRNWQSGGKARMKRAAEKLKEESQNSVKGALADSIRALSNNELTAVMAGRHPRFITRFCSALKDIEKEIAEAGKQIEQIKRSPSAPSMQIEIRALQRRQNDAKEKLTAWNSGLCHVERYTGNERRSTRDRVSTAFREVGPPWVLVASNVGSEGIDLQTYTARLVHYDLEWNPAKMEQREGRGDRVGRKLKDKLEILYCLVPRTYDERMFHQLVARDRWHGVLLGKPANKLKDEKSDARVIDPKLLTKMRLDLRPRI